MREKILDVAEELVQNQGLNAVTFQELADAVGLRKPSVFHHIKNKEELTLALIDRCGSKHGPQYAAVVEKNIPAPEKLKQIAAVFEKGLRQNRPCLLAAISGSIGSLSENASTQLQEAAESAISRFAEVFEQGSNEESLAFEGKSKEAATAFFAMLQGLQALSRASGDSRVFKKSALAYIDSITA